MDHVSRVWFDGVVMSCSSTRAERQIADSVVSLARQLQIAVDGLQFVTPSHVYNPLAYAWPAHLQFLQKFAWRRGRVMLLGMNPGPWGMAQTGVPFGEIAMVRDWLGIRAGLQPPLPDQHRKYPIRGFDCPRSEGSGKRFWGWAQQRFGTADAFFEHFFVWNYCPLLFLADNRNLVPGKLGKAEAEPLMGVCHQALVELIDVLQPRAVVGIGRWAEQRARQAANNALPVGYLHHPSPANPAANRNWPAMAEQALADYLPRD